MYQAFKTFIARENLLLHIIFRQQLIATVAALRFF